MLHALSTLSLSLMITDNLVITTRIANNVIFANIDPYKTFVQHGKDDLKEFSRLATNNAFENTSREPPQPLLFYESHSLLIP